MTERNCRVVLAPPTKKWGEVSPPESLHFGLDHCVDRPREVSHLEWSLAHSFVRASTFSQTRYGLAMSGSAPIHDRLGRPLSDLRISVTDRCNFRCTYCMPREQVEKATFLGRSDLLSFEEITEIARAFATLGVKKIRLTGGEPLLRRELFRLVGMLSDLGLDLALTTNGVLLPRFAADLRAAGLRRLTVSLDALDSEVFQKICDAPGFGPDDVLRGIKAAEAAGFSSIKINCAVRRGENEGQVVPIARHFSTTGHVVRFIEFMDVGTRNGWDPRQVVSATEIKALLCQLDELEPLPAQYRGEVAQRYRFLGGAGEVGVIASVSQPFCGDCTRARMSADGSLYRCLFAHAGYDVRSALRSGAGPEDLQEMISSWWGARVDRYSERRAISGPAQGEGRHLPVLAPKVEMSFIGG